MSNLFTSSIGKKFLMSLAGLFLITFLLVHLVLNLLVILNEDPMVFNKAAHFMGTFWAVQYLLQPVLIFGVIFHFVMGFVLEFKNWSARKVSYAKIGDMIGYNHATVMHGAKEFHNLIF